MLESLTIEQLLDKNKQLEMTTLVKSVVAEKRLREAKDLLRTIVPLVAKLPKDNPDAIVAVRLYDPLIAWLKYASLVYITDDEVVTLFHDFVGLFVQSEDVEVLESVKARMLGLAFVEEEKLRNNLAQALETSPSPLFGNLKISTLSEATSPKTVSEWVQLYRSYIGDTDDISLLRAKFYSNDKNVTTLDQKQKEALHRLVDLYDFVETSSLLPAGYAEDYIVQWGDSEVDLLSDGRLVKLPGAFEASPQTEASLSKEPSKGLATKLPAYTLTQAPTVVKNIAPAFFFDLQDETEADKFRATGPVSVAGGLEAQLRLLAEQVITVHKFNFKDEASKRRFINLFVSRLKNVRSVVDVREVLLKPVDSGGLGLLVDKAEQVIGIIEKTKTEFDARPKDQPLESRTKSLEPAVVPVPTPLLPPGIVLPKSDKVGGEPNALPEGVVKPDVLPFTEDWRQEMLQDIARLAQEVPPASGAKRAEPVASTPVSRPQLEDVKAPHRTLGPLEELKVLSLTDFRRLDSSPLEALAHVRAKIDLIGEASVTRRFEAVRAWQASPLYQLYLTLGRESIEQGKVVSQVVTDRQAAGQPTMTEAEFDAIVDFNTKIRF